MPWYMFWYYAITSASIPVWLIPALAIVATVILPFKTRLRREGLYWSVAWSDRIGGACEFISLIVSVIYLHGMLEPIWLHTHEVEISTAIIGLAVGAAASWFLAVRKADGKPGSWSDEYHNLVVVFLVICFVLPALILTIVQAIHSKDVIVLITMGILLCLYLATVAYDKYGRFKSSEQAESLILGGGLAKFIRSLIPVVKRLGEYAREDRLSTFRPWWRNVTEEMLYSAVDDLAGALKEMSTVLSVISQKKKER